jgi:imidazolonepropionase-like amidohydrolase
MSRFVVAVGLGLLVVLLAAAPAAAGEPPVLIRNVRIFDGVHAELSAGEVLVADGVIERVSSEPITAPEGAVVLDGGGGVLCPGFIDLHAHLSLQYPVELQGTHPTVAGAFAELAAASYLDSGFTTVRDAGGTHPDFARAIESGALPGPRIYPSGAILSQTSGHGDFRAPGTPHPAWSGSSPYLNSGESVLVDGVAETLRAARENLRSGATQIKIMGGGGVASDYDPIDSVQMTPQEIRAAVQAASDWGTYVLAHAYTSAAVRRLVENGVRSIEHGLLIDEETAKLVAERDVVLSTQLYIFRPDQGDAPQPNARRQAKMQRVVAGRENLIRLIKKYGIKTGFGTDLIFGQYPLVGREFTERAKYWTPAEVLRQATSESAEILRMAGPLDRYGSFGEIRQGWLADLLVVDGNPLADISLLEHPETSLALIMQAGRIHRNRLTIE